MIDGRVFIATSLDGFIARSDGAIDWLPGLDTDGGDYGYSAFLETVDGIIMGRGSFEQVRRFDPWPYPKPVVVMSRSLRQHDLESSFAGKATISAEAPEALAAELAGRGWKAAYVDGGKVIQSFLRAGLITDMIITRIPILIGDGIPLFGPVDEDIQLQHCETTAYPSGLVQSRYAVRRQE